MDKLKIIDYGKVWTCKNMNNLAPINWKGYKVLFSDGKIKVINSLDEVSEYERATIEEYKDFYRERNYLFIGDEVEIIKGKKKSLSENIRLLRTFILIKYLTLMVINKLNMLYLQMVQK